MLKFHIISILVNQINDNLQKLINSIFTKRFIKFEQYNGNFKETPIGMIPDKYKVEQLGDVISFYNGYGWNSDDMLEKPQKDSIKIFKMGNINVGGGINKSKTKSWISKEKCENLEQYVSKKGDILMCMTDMKESGTPLLGHTALIDKDNEFVINQRVGIIRCNKGVKYQYIYTLSNLPVFVKELRSKANSGVQVNLTSKAICESNIIVPDNDSLSSFNAVADKIYELIFNNNDEIEKLEQIKSMMII